MLITPTDPATLSQLDVVLLGLMFDSKFCDQECYRPEVCDKFCTVCRDLLIKEDPPCHAG